MLANCEFMVSALILRTKRADAGEKLRKGQAARLKGHCSKLARETVALARESMGGNGILDNHGVMRHFTDMEALYTYEGTYDINSLVSGKEITGGLPAFL
jgi:alkylation response protein AidB-like acyl-CoA dehydrogenase